MRSVFRAFIFVALFLASPLLIAVSKAQTLSSDSSAGTSVRTNSSQQTFSIEQGTIRGQSLFHSFDTFSPESWSVVFDLSGDTYSNIDFVIGQVTGESRSLIDGRLEILGGQSPDLLLINPAGITFGPNARLQLPGSFIASTAENIVFGNEVIVTTSASSVPLLSVSTPTGLQMGIRSADISIVGEGHRLTTNHPFLSPNTRTDDNGLRLNGQQTLALLADGVTLDGGVLTAPSGRVEIGSVSAGEVAITHQQNLLSFDYAGVNDFGNIQLRNRALADVSSAAPGLASGSLQVYGQKVEVQGGAALWMQNQGAITSGDITINASEQLLLNGVAPDTSLFSSTIVTETVASGRSGLVSVTTPRLLVDGGGIMGTRTFSDGEAGLFQINADDIEVSGHAAIAPSLFTRVGSFTTGLGNAGDIVVSGAETLTVSNGGFLGSATARNGDAGNFRIEASDIVVTGSTPTRTPSLLTTLTIGGNGRAGDLTVSTDRLALSNGGLLISSSYTDGLAGSITIDATESISVDGRVAGMTPTSIASGAYIAPLIYQGITGGERTPTGSAGLILLNTPRLQLEDGGRISVANLGTGDAGSISIVAAESINISDASISALTTSGGKGDISIQTDLLRIQSGGTLQATSLGGQDGGNVDIDATFLIGTENSDIVANATRGNGGNIDIVTQGIFGFQFRNRLTAESDITASSELGVDGSVEIEYAGAAVEAGLVSLPAYFADVDNQIVASCAEGGSNQFVASGRGGLAVQPTEFINVGRLWSDMRSPSKLAANPNHTTNESELDVSSGTQQPSILREATGWRQNNNGQIALLSEETTPPFNSQSTNCLQKTH